MNKKFWKGKKVLVTGHTGFKGSWMCLCLQELGAEIIGYALAPATSPNMFSTAAIESALSKNVIADIRDDKKLKEVIAQTKPEIIIHMAAQPLVRYSYENPTETYQTNVMGTVNLFEAARVSQTVKVILNVTTDKCYENKEWMWGYRENEALGGSDPYSSSKACSELITQAYRQSYFTHAGIALASARAGNVIGGGDWSQDRLISDLVRAKMHNTKFLLRNPHAIRPWQHVLEAISGYLLLIENLWQSPRDFASAWNFGPEPKDICSVKNIVEHIGKHWNISIEHATKNEKHLHETSLLKLDIEKARQYLSWKPKWNFHITLEKLLQWYDAWFENQDVHSISVVQIKEYINLN